MPYELRNNSGSLFHNDRKTCERHPDFKGKVMVDGKTYWISGWDKGKFMSLSISPVEAQYKGTNQHYDPTPQNAADEDVPF